VVKNSKTLTANSCLVNVFKLTYIEILISCSNFCNTYLMNRSQPALSRKVTIVNELGLHARSAAKIAELANRSKGSVWIQKGDEKADASSIVDILTLACEKGTIITIHIENKSDFSILQAIMELVESGFGE